MNDYAWQLLRAELCQCHAEQTVLWVVDENIDADDIDSFTVLDNVHALTNRYDIFTRLQQRGFKATINDFNLLAVMDKQFDAVFYRVSKEKAIVHHVINSAATCLNSGGKLWLAGYKKEGIKTYLAKAAQLLGELSSRQRGADTSLLASIDCIQVSADTLDDKNYRQAVDVSAGEWSLISKPGVYGWNKIDKGSDFLIDHLEELLTSFPSEPKTVVDLGCGYGYLSVMAAKFCDAQFIATDNNVASVQMCLDNFQRHQVNGSVVLDDCGGQLTCLADLVLCNPPFHQGFGVESDLTKKFVIAAKKLLKHGGKALFVVNSFIGLEKKASQYFSAVDTLANNGSFKLLLLTK